MESFGQSQPVKRVEDVRLVTGHGRYVDDIAPKDALFGFFFRAPVGHAAITGLDVSEAEDAPGVHTVITAERMEAMGMDIAMSFTRVGTRDGGKGADVRRPMLAQGRVRFVGEPVALVVADTLAQAKDAAELIELDLDDLPVHMELAPGGEALHPEAPDNVAFDFGLGDLDAVEAAFAKADSVVEMDISDNRVITNSMEPRACFARWDGQRLHLCYGSQGVWGIKDNLAKAFGLAPEAIHVSTPDVGGGFGMKGFDYPEYFAVAAAAKTLGKTVRWMGERTESMLSDNGGRDLVSTASMAFDKDNRILAYRIDNVSNLGAYCSTFGQLIQSFLFGRVLTGVYDIQTTWLGSRGILTNTAPVDAYRGAGRPEAIYALERMMDVSARELGVDPWELRRINFIPADAFPYKTATDETYDVGDFDRLLTRAETFADVDGFAGRKAVRKRAPWQAARARAVLLHRVDPRKSVRNREGRVPRGRQRQPVCRHAVERAGARDGFAQFLADQTGIPADRIAVIQGDSDLIARGGGTGGSRSVTTQNNATLATTGTDGFRASATCWPRTWGSIPQTSASMTSGSGPRVRTCPRRCWRRPRSPGRRGRDDLLTVQETATLPGRSFPNGAHVAEVEIDPDTGVTEVVRYSVVDDFGNLINPMLAEGQVHGGVAQGLGQAITERVVFDDQGQLLTATFMDYAMPRATDVPPIAFTTEAVPSTANPLGMKGCGEAGTVGALAAVTNAAQDAVWEQWRTHRLDMPFTPATGLGHVAGCARRR